MTRPSSAGSPRRAGGLRGAGGPRRALRPAVALALALCAAGCGIRTTSVPVDGGPAPSRVPCEVTGKNTVIPNDPGVPVRIYLMCASELQSVERTVRIPERPTPQTRRVVAQALLDALQAQPSSAESRAGFATYVSGPLTVMDPRKGDPAGTLRLSRQPEDLPTEALAQIVCTFAGSGASDGSMGGDKVVLGGPGDYPARGYACDEETKSRPDASVPTLGPLPSSS